MNLQQLNLALLRIENHIEHSEQTNVLLVDGMVEIHVLDEDNKMLKAATVIDRGTFVEVNYTREEKID